MVSGVFPVRGSQTRRRSDGVLGEVYQSDPVRHTLTVRWPTIPGAYATEDFTPEQFARHWELTGLHVDPPRHSNVAPILIALFALVFLVWVLVRNGSRYVAYNPSENVSSDSPATLNSAQALDAKYGMAAAARCAAGADDYLRAIARFRFNWDDSGMFENKFDSFEPEVVSPGMLTLTSHKARLSNGFGVFHSIELFCNYDTQSEQVLNYASKPDMD